MPRCELPTLTARVVSKIHKSKRKSLEFANFHVNVLRLCFSLWTVPFNSIGARFCVYVAFPLTFHCEWAIRESPRSLQRIIHDDLKSHPYKIQIVQQALKHWQTLRNEYEKPLRKSPWTCYIVWWGLSFTAWRNAYNAMVTIYPVQYSRNSNCCFQSLNGRLYPVLSRYVQVNYCNTYNTLACLYPTIHSAQPCTFACIADFVELLQINLFILCYHNYRKFVLTIAL